MAALTAGRRPKTVPVPADIPKPSATAQGGTATSTILGRRLASASKAWPSTMPISQPNRPLAPLGVVNLQPRRVRVGPYFVVAVTDEPPLAHEDPHDWQTPAGEQERLSDHIPAGAEPADDLAADDANLVRSLHIDHR